MNTPIYAWHFSDGTLKYDDEEVEVRSGLKLEKFTDKLTHINSFHGCTNPFDALRSFSTYSPKRLVVSRVKLEGKIVNTYPFGIGSQTQMLLAQKRTHLWVADAIETLEDFTIGNVEDLIHALSEEGIKTHPVIFNTLNTRRKWSKSEESFSVLQDAIESMHVNFDDIPQKSQLSRMRNLLSLHNNASLEENIESALIDVPQTAKDCLEANRNALNESYKAFFLALQKISKEKTRLFVLGTMPIVLKTLHSLCNYRAWKHAYDKGDDTLDKIAKEFFNSVMTGLKYGKSALIDLVPPPPSDYLSIFLSTLPSPEKELHQQLMSLAPKNYTEYE